MVSRCPNRICLPSYWSTASKEISERWRDMDKKEKSSELWILDRRVIFSGYFIMDQDDPIRWKWGLGSWEGICTTSQDMGLYPDTKNCRLCRECQERFPRHRLQRKPQVSDPGMHHGTCMTHVPWCMSGSLTLVGIENLYRHSQRMRNP